MIPSDSGLSIENLWFSYPEYPGVAARDLFSGLNLELPSESIALLLARPDEGKTTLCRVLAGLIPRFTGGELRGQIRLGGLPLLDHHPFELIEQIGLVFQHPGEQLLASQCDSEVAFPLESLGIPRSEIERRVDSALQAMALERYRHESPKVLSGGEKKKLLIACLLAVDPRLWLLDETLEELDQGTKRRLLQFLKERRRSTLILSAKWHDLFREYVQRVFLLEQGKVQGIAESIESPEFHSLLLKRGFVLPKKGWEPLKVTSHAAAPRSAEKPGTRDGETLLIAEDLYFRYAENGEESAFSLKIDHLHITIGRTTALVGDNGSGKSTLGRILCGLLTPGKGKIRIRIGGGLRPARADALNRFTGYLFQDPDLQIFLPTVFEELALGLKHLHLAAEEIDRRVRETIALFDLPATEAPPSLMSYGARKKLQAAVYYLLDRPLMIIDEGDSGLSVNDFTGLVRRFQKRDSALIFITHDRRLADALADEVVELKSGSFV